MNITAEQVRTLREITGAGMMDCKRALKEAGGDMERAQALLREKGLATAAKRAGKVASEGLVEAFIQGAGKRGALIELNCETDFVANTEEFQEAAREIARQVVAGNPWWVSREDVPEEVIEQERKVYQAQAREEGKPDNVLEKIVEGKLEKGFFRQQVLLDQPYYRDDSRTVGDMLAEVSAKVNEKVEVRRFARFERGEDVARG